MRKRIIRSVVLAAVLAAIVLAVLVYVPRTQTTKYEMKGYIVSLDGKVLDEFPLLISVKEYDFVIDRKDGDFSISGNKVMAERDGIAMKIHWDYSQITEKIQRPYLYCNSLSRKRRVSLQRDILLRPGPERI